MNIAVFAPAQLGVDRVPKLRVKARSMEHAAEQIRELVPRLERFSSKASTVCPYCEKAVDHVSQKENAIYLWPCGCPLWEGQIPVAWR